MLERILNFSFFGENFKNVNLPAFIKEGMVSIMLYLFEKLCLHVFLWGKAALHFSYDLQLGNSSS